ncbi:hypothetical protein TNCV_1805211 [Trichonephila clavipes]|nr:hypothetical protein TNCV_1805211 [Trichonephila clavipes]
MVELDIQLVKDLLNDQIKMLKLCYVCYMQGCYLVQFQKKSFFHRTIKRSPYEVLFRFIAKLYYSILKQQDHDITLTPEDLTTGQLETVNNSTSTGKTSRVLLVSDGKEAVSYSKACCAICGMESTGAYLSDMQYVEIR